MDQEEMIRTPLEMAVKQFWAPALDDPNPENPDLERRRFVVERTFTVPEAVHISSFVLGRARSRFLQRVQPTFQEHPRYDEFVEFWGENEQDKHRRFRTIAHDYTTDIFKLMLNSNSANWLTEILSTPYDGDQSLVHTDIGDLLYDYMRQIGNVTKALSTPCDPAVPELVDTVERLLSVSKSRFNAFFNDLEITSYWADIAKIQRDQYYTFPSPRVYNPISNGRKDRLASLTSVYEIWSAAECLLTEIASLKKGLWIDHVGVPRKTARSTELEVKLEKILAEADERAKEAKAANKMRGWFRSSGTKSSSSITTVEEDSDSKNEKRRMANSWNEKTSETLTLIGNDSKTSVGSTMAKSTTYSLDPTKRDRN